MAKKTDELVIEVKGDASDLIRTFDNVQDRVKDVVYSMESSFSKIGGSLDKVTTGFAKFGLAVDGVKTALAPFEKVIERLNNASGLQRTSDRLGINVEKFQELSFVAKRFGSDSETLADAIKDLNERIGDAARDGGNYDEQLKKIGLSSKELLNLSADEQFKKTAEAIGQLNTVGEQNFVTAELMGDAGFRLIEVFRQSPEAIKGYIKEARELGAVLREDDIVAMEDAAIALKKMETGFVALGDQLIVLVSGPLKQFADAATEALKKINKALPEAVTPLGEIKSRIAELKREIEETQEAVDPDGIIDKFFSSEEKREKAKKDLAVLNKELKALQEEAEKLSSADNAATFDKIFNSNEDTANGGGSTFNGVSDSEEQEAIDDIGRLLGLSKNSAEAMTEAMEFEETLAANIAESKQRAADLEVAIALQKEVDKVKAAQDAADQEIAIEKMKQKAKADILRNLSSLMNTESKKMFEVGKAAAVAQGLMNTYEGATKALAQGGIYGVVLAAAVTAAGLNNVNNIRSQSFGSAGGGAASTGGASSIGDLSSISDQASQQQGPTNITEATINITGDNVSGDSVRALVAELREYQEDGGELVIK